MGKVRPMPFGRRKWAKRDIFTASLILSFHIPCIFAPFYFNWSAFWVAFILYILTGLFGISISYHRNLSHKSFKLPKWLEYVFAYCGVHAVQGDPIDWVSTHRYHHQYTDTERDPHSPVQGFWFSYVMWTIDIITLTNKVCPDPNNVADMENDAFYRFIRDTYLLHPIALGVLLYAVGGTPFFLWGMCVRSSMFMNVSFMVNSICHSWGKKQWNTNDSTRNNWWISLLSFGESWHNNHHAFEYSARVGIEWWEVDIGWYVILFLQAIGLATDVKQPSQAHKQRLSMDKPNESCQE
ncbi:palmitoyl-monogalactosyldiacylglycerol delta-7 desaturase, chloroplastic-like [Cucumis melo]|uniref:Palmitoyl-monogalactosyldiacylglycerol delta-7 desaturase, chloroplastic-like n=1 Tax=Cucumis melo TaxID=3656 RepID=A0ABM3L234_CUCME|nr:palmitoyl-monogalactosyldiacylglycerol delta-7 desaturase, chloroplastic-like [Cucumis melo]